MRGYFRMVFGKWPQVCGVKNILRRACQTDAAWLQLCHGAPAWLLAGSGPRLPSTDGRRL